MDKRFERFEERPLVVLALGGNALSPPGSASDKDDYGTEREIVARTAGILDGLIHSGYRLLIVHGNGPQVGRLLRTDPQRGNLDIHVAQTQGELGYLLAAAMKQSPTVGVLTRVVVTEPLGPAVKPVGPILAEAPLDQTCVRTANGWRVTVPSPKPARVVECAAIEDLLRSHHVVAGGGGGVPIDEDGRPLDCVVDKDWVASLLAVALEAQHLVFATDVECVYDGYDRADARALGTLCVPEALAMIDNGTAAPGSMAPKLASAADYVVATGKSAHICGLTGVVGAVSGAAGAGTLITP